MDQELYIKLAAVTKFYRKENDLAMKYQQAETQIENIKRKFEEQKNRGNPVTFRYWAISVVLCIYGVAGVIFGLAAKFSTEQFWGEAQALGMLLLPAGIVLLLVGVCRICSVNRKRNKHEKKYQEIWNKNYQPQVDQNQEMIDKIAENLRYIYKEYGSMLTFLPEQYRNLQATAFMFMAVRDGRADTLKEAYNLYEEQLHRWKLEDAAYQAAEMQRYAAMAAEELNSQMAEMNTHLSSIENLEMIKYLHGQQ